MYLSYYNLVKKPFQLTTDPDFLWFGEKHKEAYATLKYAIIENKGVLVLTGDVGTGKTTLINALIKSLEEDIVAVTIYDPSLEVLEFFNEVATALKMGKTFESKGKFITYFRQFLHKAHERKQKVLLIIDEAQSLSKELLENIRLLSNIELPNEKLINIFFVGQDELNQTLASQECRALRQRIVLTYNIKPLSAIDIFEYIKYRLKVAGTDIKLFNRKAIKEVYRFSSGYPRLINTICDHALLTGYVRKLNKITPAIIIDCSHELNLSGEIKKSTFSNFFEQPHTEYLPRFMKYPSDNAIGMEVGASKEAEISLTSLHQIKSTKKSMNLAEDTKGNSTKDSTEPTITCMRRRLTLWVSTEPTITRMRRRLTLWVSTASFAVIIMALIGLSTNEIISKENWQKSATPVLTTPESSQTKQDSHFASLTYIDKSAQNTPAHSIKILPTEIPKKQKSIALELAKEELNNKNYIRAVELFEDIMDRNPENMPDVKLYYSQALRGLAGSVLRENPRKAEILLRKALETDPQNAGAYFDLGKLYTRSKDYSKAIKAYRKSEDLNYRSTDTFFNLGFIYAAKKNFMNAEKMFLLVVESRPQYLDKALFNLAVVQQRQGKRKQYIENLRQALTINPKNQKARKYLNRFKSNSEGAE